VKLVLATPAHVNEQELAADHKRLPSVSPARLEGHAHVSMASPYSAGHTVPAPRSPLPAAPVSAIGRIEAPDLKPPSAASSHDIRVRIPDERGGATEVRFFDTGTDVRVSVRTADAELAHSLRAGLSDLTQRLTANGIQTELWRPGSDQSFSQGGESSHQFQDSNGSGRGNNPFQDAQQDDPEASRPYWLEELEASTGGARP
jgi:hypothetical protein